MPAPDLETGTDISTDISTEVGPDVVATAVEHARRGVRLQVALRWLLVGFVALTVLTVPPEPDLTTCAVIAVLYAGWALGVALWVRREHSSFRVAWLALFV